MELRIIYLKISTPSMLPVDQFSVNVKNRW
jgi:hypothetical protein